MRTRITITGLATLILVFSCAAVAQQPAAQPKATDGKAAAPPTPGSEAETPFTIGSEDVLKIEVWSEPRLNGTFTVRPDGKITLNLIDEVHAAGKTPLELAAEIAERLREQDIIKAPRGRVEVEKVNSRKYYIQGEVNKPGEYPLVNPTRVLEALVNAGGFREFANTKKIRILRMKNNSLKEFRFNWNDVVKGKNISQNIYLLPGDQIIVR
jgi:polysaccharide biosynthesis/export protein